MWEYFRTMFNKSDQAIIKKLRTIFSGTETQQQQKKDTYTELLMKKFIKKYPDVEVNQKYIDILLWSELDDFWTKYDKK